MFGDPAFQRNVWEYCVTEPAVDKSKMAVSKLQLYASPLPDEISTKFQRLYLRFRGQAFYLAAILNLSTSCFVTECSHKFQYRLLDLQNMGEVAVAVGIPYISCLGAELFALEFFWPPSWITHLRFGWTVSALVPLDCWTPKT